MKIEILSTESLGIRGLCCSVETDQKRIIIDPGISLALIRAKLPPHPIEAVHNRLNEQKIQKYLSNATDIVFSHYHGDHIPMPPNERPFELNGEVIKLNNPKPKIWWKDGSNLGPKYQERIQYLESIFKTPHTPCDNTTQECFTFSLPHWHGRPNRNPVRVMMTRIQSGSTTFLHASDIQLLHDDPIEDILNNPPNILLFSGPPLYLGISKIEFEAVQRRTLQLAEQIETIIIDHHLMRGPEGLEWLKEMRSKTGKEIICAADWNQTNIQLLETNRKQLYNDFPEDPKWFEPYRMKLKTADDILDRFDNGQIDYENAPE